jgi:ATP-binding cassette subfamily B protein
VRSFAAEAQDAHAEAGAAATEVIGGIRTVKAFSQEAAEASRYSGLLVKAVELARRKIRRTPCSTASPSPPASARRCWACGREGA